MRRLFDKIEQSELDIRDQVIEEACEIIEEICMTESIEIDGFLTYRPLFHAIESGVSKILQLKVSMVVTKPTYTDEELMKVVAGRGSTGDGEIDEAIKEEYIEWRTIICSGILHSIDRRIDRPLPNDSVELLARFKGASLELHDQWTDDYKCHILFREMPRYVAENDLPGQVKWLSAEERMYRMVGDEFRQSVFQQLKNETQEKLNEEINYISHSKALGYSEASDLSRTSLPPLLRILTSKDVTHAQIALLIEELIPGFSEETFSNQTIKSRFLAALSGKKSQTFRQKWSDHYGTTRKKSKVYQNTDKGLIENWVNEIDEQIKSTDKQIQNKKLL